MPEDGEVTGIGASFRTVEHSYTRSADFEEISDFDPTPVEEQTLIRDGLEWSVVIAQTPKKISKCKFCFRVGEEIGKGTFGLVRQIVTPDGECYAMKQLEYDPRYTNREVSIMRALEHPNCVRLLYYYVERDRQKSDMTVKLIMELFPTSLSMLLLRYRHNKAELSLFHIRLYLYQLLRGVAYLHLEGIAHRDIKPQNILIKESTAQLKICDFGSAKILKESEPNVSYICSRFYRAPELILENVFYDSSIDTWAVGCVFAELFLLRPLFVGDTSLDQFSEIIQILGTPTAGQVEKLHPKFPKDIRRRDPIRLQDHLKRSCPRSVCVLEKLLQYVPDERIRCWDALAEPYFDEIRRPDLKLPKGRSLPPVFDFSDRELDQNPVLNQRLIPRAAEVAKHRSSLSTRVL